MRRFLGVALFGISLLALGCASSGGTAGTGATGGMGGGTGGDAGTGGLPGTWPPDADVFLDEYGIFNADCATDTDCAMALGYFHARDRFVQMDLQRRLSTGRLTEVVNKTLVEQVGLLDALIDTAAENRALYSTRDGRLASDAAIENTDEKTRGLLDAYAVGVNQWLSDVRGGENDAVWPVEFESPLLDYGPEDASDWTPADSVATILTLIGSLTNDEDKHFRAQQALDRIGDIDRYLDLWSLEPVGKSPILEQGSYPTATASLLPGTVEKKVRNPGNLALTRRAQRSIAALSDRPSSADLLRRLFPQTEIANSSIGSNNWVLGPSKTASGNTILSNDPHLGLSQPAVWYLAHLDAKTNGTGELHTAGATFAGLPYVIVGQNETIAWGVTNTGLDFTDVYVEELVKDEEGEPFGVRFNGEVVEFVRVDFELEFSDGSSETRELLFVPHHGPVRSIDSENDVAVTLRWTGNDITTDVNIPSALGQATTVLEARDALENGTTIGQNWVVIDNQGNFGWFPYNRIPKRTWAENLDLTDPSEPFPWFPLPGTGEYEWDEYFAYEELPQAFNLSKGWIATANSDHTGASFDGNPTNDGFAPQQTDNISSGYRTIRIVELIEETDEHTPATNAALISDVESAIGRDMVPPILAIANDAQTTLTPEAQKVVNALSAWNYDCPTGLDGTDPVMSPLADTAEVEESSGCTAWHQTIRAVNDALAGDESSKEYPSFVTYYSLIDPSRLRAGDVYWDDVRTPAVETRFDIIAAALDTAGSELVAELGEDEAVWPWGRKHGFRLRSLLASLSALFDSFNNPPGAEDFFANDGGLFTVDVASPNREGIHGSGASIRFQCEGTTPVQCTIQLPGGQSAFPDSPNYDDLLELYLRNESIDIAFDINEVAARPGIQSFRFTE